MAAAVGTALLVTNLSVAAANVELAAAGNRIVFTPSEHAPGFQLRVTGPGPFLVEKTWLANETMALTVGGESMAWQDGAYSYEVAPITGMAVRSNAAGGSHEVDLLRANSGSFALQAGRVLVPTTVPEWQRTSDLDSGSAGKDQVIADDLIVQGSACVGLDCVNNESFGFDTIRMKENNIRIKFEDTSADAFPSTDWQLTANDSASGGANRFSIEDVTAATIPFTVTGGAPNNSLFIDSQSRIGIGTAVPALQVHQVRGDTPAIRLEQTGTSGFTPQTWDIAGNEANFFVRDVTGGSRLPLRIRPGAPTSSIDIGASGDVGVGTASPAANLHVSRAGSATLRLTSATITADWDIKNNADTGRLTYSDDPSGVRVPFKFARNAVNNLLRIGVLASNTVDINGNLLVTGTITPDYVFEKDFALPSIQEHADFMWKNRHLPKVQPATVNEEGKGVIDVGARSQGVLEELEYAHIYIDQLHSDVRELESEAQARDAKIAQLQATMQALAEELRAKR